MRDWIGKKGPFEPRLSRLSAARKRQALPPAATQISRKPFTHKAFRAGKAVFGCLTASTRKKAVLHTLFAASPEAAA
ncbi:MAG: hypothetical protein KA451_07235 [Methyloversatilis sp.]|nr:hypothetical protein [Methyloversatilis sp.]